MAARKIPTMFQRRKPVSFGNWEGAPPPLVRKTATRPQSLRKQKVYYGLKSVTPVPVARERKEIIIPWRFILVLLLVSTTSIAYYKYRYLVMPEPQLAPEAIALFGALPLEPLIPDAPRVRDYRIRHKVASGETFSTILDRYGFNDDDASAIHQAMQVLGQDSKKALTLKKGQGLEFVMSADGKVQSLESSLAPGSEMVVQRSEEGAFAASLNTIAKEPRERIAVGKIERSFAAAASTAGISYDTVDDLVDLFSSRVSFHKDFKKGDRFTLIYQDKVLPDGTSKEAGPILAAALQINGEQLFAVRYVGTDGKSRYFDGKGKLIGDTYLRYPLKFSRISSYFTTARFHPVLKIKRPHNGVDFAAPIGTPVRAIADGQVLAAGRNGGSGIMVKLQHNERYSTAYLHLSSIGKGVRQGGTVRQGDIIGAVGMTGLATGPHLHFSFYDYGKYVDPLKIKLPNMESLGKGTNINSRYLKRVLYTLHHYQNVELSGFYWE